MDFTALQQARLQAMNRQMSMKRPMQPMQSVNPSTTASTGMNSNNMDTMQNLMTQSVATSPENVNRSINIELSKIAKIFSGPFLIFILIFLGILVFFTLGNCVIYGLLITEDQDKNPKINKGYAIFMLAMNVIGLILLSICFIWIIVKFNSYKSSVQNSLLRVSNFVMSCADKGVKF